MLEKLSIGLELSFLFGTVDEESWVITDPLVNIMNHNYYNGFKFKTGFQYTLPNLGKVKTTIGGTIELPTKLRGTQTRNAYKTFGDYEIVLTKIPKMNWITLNYHCL